MEIDNRDCHWAYQPAPDMPYECCYSIEGERPQCIVNQLCCRYVSNDAIDEYIRMLLKEVGEE